MKYLLTLLLLMLAGCGHPIYVCKRKISFPECKRPANLPKDMGYGCSDIITEENYYYECNPKESK